MVQTVRVEQVYLHMTIRQLITSSQGSRRGRDFIVVGFITTYAITESVPITTNVVSSNRTQARCTRYNIM